MPMKRVLEEGGTFDPKAVAIRLEALNGIVASLIGDNRRQGEGCKNRH